jgi:hypothetical protein
MDLFAVSHSSFRKKNVREKVHPISLDRKRLTIDQYTPEISAIDPASLENGLQVDNDTKDMLRSLGVFTLGFGDGLTVV